ncbi:MAG: HlyC/CorC family transporter [Rhodospirillaceae bacterium]|nr:HlyC/CorC family transporter [Rhodospirillaceae bacterium]
MIFMTVVVLVLLTVAAFFSAAETALTAVSKSLMHQLHADGDARAGTVTRLLERRERLIATVLVGNNLVNILASALTTSVMIAAFGDEGVVYATAIMTVLIVVYGEILPKTYALLHTTAMSLRAAGLMSALVWLFRPLNVAIEVFVNGTLRLFGVSTAQVRTAQQIIAELRGTIEMQMSEKAVKDEVKIERNMLRSVLDLNEVEVGQILIHRKKVVTIDADLPIAEIIEQVAASPYSRIPLWREQPDNIVGVLHAKNLLRAIESAGVRTDRVDVVALAQPPWFIPETTRLLDQMNAFRERREHFALVVDEYGALKGIVTLEDIIEEIVGDIRDEHDVAVQGLRPQADGSYLIDGSVSLRDLNRELDWSLPDDHAATLAGLVLYESRMIPEQGQRFTFHGYRFEVARRQRNQITLIRVSPPRQQAPATPEKRLESAA